MSRSEAVCVKQRCVLVAMVSCGLVHIAVGQDPVWVRQLGTILRDDARALAVDGVGGVFVTGSTTGSLGGASAGWYDVWFARYSGAGEKIWIRQFGTASWDEATSIAPDGGGGIFMGGFSGGNLGGASAGAVDAWLGRYDHAGTQIWIRQLGTMADDTASGVALADDGGVFIGGRTFGALAGPQIGLGDAWIARYDATGNQIWIRQIGTMYSDGISSLTSDGSGGLFVAGETRGSLGGTNEGQIDAWLARYDDSGTQLWIRQIGTIESERALALGSDGEGGLYIAGQTWGSLGGVNAGHSDPWLARYDSAGNQMWIRQWGSAAPESAHSIALAQGGRVVVAGITASGNGDAWLAHYSASGEQVFYRQYGTIGEDVCYAVAADHAGRVYVAGSTDGSFAGGNAGHTDAWLAQFRIPCYANCDGSTVAPVLNVDDFTCYINEFASALTLPHAQQFTHYANCDGSTQAPALNVDDFTCFINAFAQGCS